MVFLVRSVIFLKCTAKGPVDVIVALAIASLLSVLNHESSSMRLSLVEKLTLLQMNCGFMDKVKKKYPNLLLEQVNMASEVGQERKSEAMELAKSL